MKKNFWSFDEKIKLSKCVGGKTLKHKNIINSLEIKLDAINSKLNASNTVEVDEKTYDSKIYYVDPSTFDILNDEGDIIGKWDKSADKPLLIF